MNNYLNDLNRKDMSQAVSEILAQAKEFKTPIIQADSLNLMIKTIKTAEVKSVLEIGSAIGFSAIMMALETNCFVTTIERDEKSYEKAKENIKKTKLESRINLILADALEYDMTEDYHCDLLFIDAAKGAYKAFFEKYIPYLNPRGIVICDNLLFHGLVADESLCKTKNQRKIADKIRNFNKYLMERQDFTTNIYDIGDGLSISVKKR